MRDKNRTGMWVIQADDPVAEGIEGMRPAGMQPEAGRPDDGSCDVGLEDDQGAAFDEALRQLRGG